MTRRVVLGKQHDSSFGLRVSLPGSDALTCPDWACSFDSSWNNIAELHQVGIYTHTGGVPDDRREWWVYPDPGYKPFVEVRMMVGSTIYDDYFGENYGAGARIDTYRTQIPSLSVGSKTMCIAYKIPVPSQ